MLSSLSLSLAFTTRLSFLPFQVEEIKGQKELFLSSKRFNVLTLNHANLLASRKSNSRELVLLVFTLSNLNEWFRVSVDRRT